MGFDPQPGMSLRLPCRSCGSFVPVKLVPGKSPASCTSCQRLTEVELTPEGSGWRIRTRPSAPAR